MRQLSMDVSRCNDWSCPMLWNCARHVVHLPSHRKRENYPQSFFPRYGKDQCSDFIGDDE